MRPKMLLQSKYFPIVSDVLNFKMDVDAGQLLDSAVGQLQMAVEAMKQQQSRDAKIWQKRVFELQDQIKSLNSQLQETVNHNARLQQELGDVTAECDRLRSANNYLSKQVKEKEQELSRFASINQSIKSLLEGSNGSRPVHLDDPIMDLPITNKFSKETSGNMGAVPGYALPNYEADIKAPQKISPKNKPKQKSKSTEFLHAAKIRLTQPKFQELIYEINNFNLQKQNREETIAGVKKILVPDYQDLFELFLPVITR